jgi:hypothetical protein
MGRQLIDTIPHRLQHGFAACLESVNTDEIYTRGVFEDFKALLYSIICAVHHTKTPIDVNIKLSRGSTPLTVLINTMGRENELSFLIRQGVIISKHDITLAIERGHIKYVHMLLGAMACASSSRSTKPHSIEQDQLLNKLLNNEQRRYTGKSTSTPEVKASELSALTLQYLAEGANPDVLFTSSSSKSHTPFKSPVMKAIECRPEVMLALLQGGANLSLPFLKYVHKNVTPDDKLPIYEQEQLQAQGIAAIPHKTFYMLDKAGEYSQVKVCGLEEHFHNHPITSNPGVALILRGAFDYLHAARHRTSTCQTTPHPTHLTIPSASTSSIVYSLLSFPPQTEEIALGHRL